MLDSGTELFGKLVIQLSIYRKFPWLSVSWHFKHHSLPFFPLAKPTGLFLGGKWQVLAWLTLRSVVRACAWQLIILFMIMAPPFTVLFEGTVSVTWENYVWVGREVNIGLKIHPAWLLNWGDSDAMTALFSQSQHHLLLFWFFFFFPGIHPGPQSLDAESHWI